MDFGKGSSLFRKKACPIIANILLQSLNDENVTAHVNQGRNIGKFLISFRNWLSVVHVVDATVRRQNSASLT